jgi:hypothetical protein
MDYQTRMKILTTLGDHTGRVLWWAPAAGRLTTMAGRTSVL